MGRGQINGFLTDINMLFSAKTVKWMGGIAAFVVVVLACGWMAGWFYRFQDSYLGISSFTFVNNSDRPLNTLDLNFVCVLPEGCSKDAQFSKNATNLLPGNSVDFRIQAPELVLTSLFGTH